MINLEIVSYEPALKPFFKSINVEWLSTYFFVTEEDVKQLSDPEKIIRDGGCVFFAKADDEIAGTCALVKVSDVEYEIVKMGVIEKFRCKKIGNLMMKELIDEAGRRGATLISLETAYQLTAALALYSKFGFTRVTEESTHPLFGRKTFKMELKIG